ncbi:hypothetical protein BpHYR1_051545 [Brachionus plicatilis]|uniref:Uncharacterized protein n=1 Tax=Brachionus plicatilis TaxID=10195 RepID=A0A3M7Q1R8_BRAPC|nr:hypothetical protein BpHYR1_051545 [Brachionus plicatilis]
MYYYIVLISFSLRIQYNLKLACTFPFLNSSLTFPFSNFPLRRVEEKKESRKGRLEEQNTQFYDIADYAEALPKNKTITTKTGNYKNYSTNKFHIALKQTNVNHWKIGNITWNFHATNRLAKSDKNLFNCKLRKKRNKIYSNKIRQACLRRRLPRKISIGDGATAHTSTRSQNWIHSI